MKIARILVKREDDILASYEIGNFTYDTEDEFIQKRERLKELLKRVKLEEVQG